jgi:hypothetical protein
MADKKNRPIVTISNGKIHYSGLSQEELELLRSYGIDTDRIDVVIRRDDHIILFRIGGKDYLVSKENLKNG